MLQLDLRVAAPDNWCGTELERCALQRQQLKGWHSREWGSCEIITPGTVRISFEVGSVHYLSAFARKWRTDVIEHFGLSLKSVHFSGNLRETSEDEITQVLMQNFPGIIAQKTQLAA